MLVFQEAGIDMLIQNSLWFLLNFVLPIGIGVMSFTTSITV